MSFRHLRALLPAVLALVPAGAFSAVPDRILSKPDGARLSTLQGRRHPEAIAPNDRGPVDPALRIDYATLYLKPAPGLEAFLADQQNPSSPDYHRWLTPEQFGERFGASANDTTQIVSWLQSQSLTVHDIARGRHWITFSGTAARMSKAFHTEFRRYFVKNVLHYANSTEISLPAAFAPVVRAVDGLDDFALEPMHRAVPLATLQPNLNATTGKHYLAPDDLATIYNIAPLYASKTDGTGQKIAIVGRTAINLRDLRNFRTYFNLPPRDPEIVLYGPDPGIRQSDLTEADLDLEWAGAIARNATIVYVYSTSINVSAQYAVDQNVAPVMSMSYGGCELTQFDTLRPVAQQAAAQGITWAIASGDSGAATCDRSAPTPQATKGATVAYPASIPEVTAVGGTQLDDSSGIFWSPGNSLTRASALSYIPEKVWNQSVENNSIEGGGGGASAMFAKPAWQLGPGVPNDGKRDLPDISFASATYIGYVVFSNDVSYIVGGTSAASPVFAGMVALLNQSLIAKDPKAPVGLGNINPALYRLARSNPGVFHDITVGDNSMPCMQGTPDCVNGRVGFPAQPGYDLGAGLGSLDVARFVNEWSLGTASTTTVSGSPGSYDPNDKVALTATVTGAAQPPTGTVTFVGNDTTLGTAVLVPGAVSSTAELSVGGLLLAGGNGAVGALYSGDATFTASSGSVVLTLKKPAAGSLVLPSVSPNPVRQNGSSWPYTLQIAERAGVATKITAFTVNNVNNLSVLPDPNIAPGSTNYLQLSGSNLSVPLDRVYHFEGVDANGATWQREFSVPFLGSDGNHIAPGISLTVSPSTIQQNPNADPACQWSQQITVQETSGFQVNLSTFTAGGVSQTSRISQLFGATRLAPFGLLSATLCSSGVSAPSIRTYSVSGTSELNTTVTATASATLSAPAASAAAFSVSQPSVNIADNSSLDLKFASGSPAWTASVFPSGQKWLTISGASGTGNATLNLSASAAGLSKGVYSAVLQLQALNTIPQIIPVPVTFVVGRSDTTTINGIGNAASGDQVFAPGQLVAVYGTSLAPSTLSAAIQPLPLQLAGVSATVNGVSAPLWFISPGQINLQIPYEVSAGSAVLGVNNNGQVSPFRFLVSPAAPGIFAFQGALVPFATATPGQVVFGFITGDGDVIPTLPSGASPASGTSLSRLPQPRQPIGVTVGGRTAALVFNGIVPGLVGVTQVNFTVPADISPGIQPVVVTVGGVSGAPVNLTVIPHPN